jgi:hypothetical protein
VVVLGLALALGARKRFGSRARAERG